MVQSEGLYRAPESANPSGHPTDPSQMAATMEMSASANQITGFNTRIRQDSCVRPLFVTKINFAEALLQHEPFNWTTIRTLINSICLPLYLLVKVGSNFFKWVIFTSVARLT